MLNIIDNPDGEKHKITFQSGLSDWIYPNRRVGRAKHTWAGETLKQIWEEIRVDDRRWRNTTLNLQREDIRSRIRELARTEEEKEKKKKRGREAEEEEEEVEEQIPIAYFVYDREERNRGYVRNHSTNERRRNEFQSGGFLRTVRETGTSNDANSERSRNRLLYTDQSDYTTATRRNTGTGAASSNQPNTFLNGGFLRTVRNTGTGAASSNLTNFTH